MAGVASAPHLDSRLNGHHVSCPKTCVNNTPMSVICLAKSAPLTADNAQNGDSCTAWPGEMRLRVRPSASHTLEVRHRRVPFDALPNARRPGSRAQHVFGGHPAVLRRLRSTDQPARCCAGVGPAGSSDVLHRQVRVPNEGVVRRPEREPQTPGIAAARWREPANDESGHLRRRCSDRVPSIPRGIGPRARRGPNCSKPEPLGLSPAESGPPQPDASRLDTSSEGCSRSNVTSPVTSRGQDDYPLPPLTGRRPRAPRKSVTTPGDGVGSSWLWTRVGC